MKTIIDERYAVRLYTITDVAQMLGVTATSLWQRIYKTKSFPEPTIKEGRRLYYSQAFLETLK